MPQTLDPQDIVRLAIHPAIGIARVGNHPGAFFLGPEAPGMHEPSPGTAKQDSMVRRQGARFRIYATLKSGEVVEVTSAQAEITWKVAIANLKAGWYQFNNAMDLPANLAIPSVRRNAAVAGLARNALDIRPSPITISGKNAGGLSYHFNNGTWNGQPVYLGEVRTDDEGRLTFLGGRGESVPATPGAQPTTFANNDGWRDDVSDGTVRARIRIGNWTKEALAAHVVTAPPNYAPGIVPIVTMYDTVRDMNIRTGRLMRPSSRISFTADIWPIFDRMTQYQWVNHGFFLLLGHGSLLDARDPQVIARLSDASPPAAAMRKRIFALFRDPAEAVARPAALPPLYGDTYSEYVDIGAVNLSVTPTMYEDLRQWAEGNFISDWTGFPASPAFDQIPAAEQPAALDRAALEGIMGGPFHPGIELTWTMRWPESWAEPFRLKPLPDGVEVRQDYGDTLTREICLAVNGPITTAGPGSLTRWLGVPWQTDEASCGSGRDYTPSFFLSVPSFWGARVPNEVLAVESFDLAADKELSSAMRSKHFAHRENWLRDIAGRNYRERIANMVVEWWKLGFVERQANTDALLPAGAHVEIGRAAEYPGDDPTLVLAQAVASLDKAAPPPSAGPAFSTPAAPPRPPKRRYSRGEV